MNKKDLAWSTANHLGKEMTTKEHNNWFGERCAERMIEKKHRMFLSVGINKEGRYFIMDVAAENPSELIK